MDKPNINDGSSTSFGFSEIVELIVLCLFLYLSYKIIEYVFKWLYQWLKRFFESIPSVRVRKYAELQKPLSLLCTGDLNLNFDNAASNYILAMGPKLGNTGQYAAFGYKTEKHLLSIAPNRTGKGRGLILPNLLDLPEHSVFVIDPKGENALVSARYRRSQGHRVVIFNPYGIFADEFAARGFDQFQTFNPLASLSPDSPTFADDVANIAEALIYDTGGDSHWTESARGLVEFLIMYLVTDSKECGNRTFRRLRELIAGGHPGLTNAKPGEKFSVLERAFFSDCHLVRENVGRYERMNEEVAGVFATAETQTRIFKSDAICAALAGEAFDFWRMKHQKTSVYLILPTEHLISKARYLRLVLLCAMSQFMRGEKGKHPVLMMLDEFANLGTLKVIENSYGLIAGHGVTLWSFVQNLTQLKNLYEKNWPVFLANSGVVTVSNVNDVETAKYFSERAGRELVPRTSKTESTNENTSSGVSKPSSFFGSADSRDSSGTTSGTSTSYNTRENWEDSLPVSTLYNADADCAFVFLEGMAKPVRIVKMYYDLIEPFRSRADSNPMHSGRRVMEPPVPRPAARPVPPFSKTREMLRSGMRARHERRNRPK